MSYHAVPFIHGHGGTGSNDGNARSLRAFVGCLFVGNYLSEVALFLLRNEGPWCRSNELGPLLCPPTVRSPNTKGYPRTPVKVPQAARRLGGSTFLFVTIQGEELFSMFPTQRSVQGRPFHSKRGTTNHPTAKGKHRTSGLGSFKRCPMFFLGVQLE